MKQKITIILLTFISIAIFWACKDEELPEITGNNKIELTIIEDTTSYVFSELTCNLNLQAAFPVEDHGFCWDTISNVNIEKQNNSSGVLSSQGFTENIETLLPNKTYYVKAYIQNGDVVIYSNELTIQTLDARPIVTTSEIVNIKANSAESGGNATAYEELFPITQKGICWAEATEPTINDSLKYWGIGNGSFNCEMLNLKISTTYYVRAFAINKEGINYGNMQSYTTTNGLPIINTNQITNITATDAISGGNILSDGGFFVTVRGVCWSNNPSPTIDDMKTVNGSGIGLYTSNITGLIEWDSYYVRAYAINEIGIAYGTKLEFEAKSSLVDYDGNIYETVKIGNQIWMKENLATTHYSDGTPLIDGTSIGDLTGDYISKYYFAYNDNDSYVSTYGHLYTWAAIMNGESSSNSNPSGVQGACPDGWHIPSDTEWVELTDYLGGETVAGGKMKETGISHWQSPNSGATNESGFSALPAGSRLVNSFNNLGQKGVWWSSTSYASNVAKIRDISYDNIFIDNDLSSKEMGYSVRCIKD